MSNVTYISHDCGFAAGHHPAGQDPDGHHLITRMNALVLLRKLDQAEVEEVIQAKDWQEARRLIRSVRVPVSTDR